MCNHVNIATIVQKKHSVVRLLMLNKYGNTHLVIERLIDLSIFGRHSVSASTKTEKVGHRRRKKYNLAQRTKKWSATENRSRYWPIQHLMNCRLSPNFALKIVGRPSVFKNVLFNTIYSPYYLLINDSVRMWQIFILPDGLLFLRVQISSKLSLIEQEKSQIMWKLKG